MLEKLRKLPCTRSYIAKLPDALIIIIYQNIRQKNIRIYIHIFAQSSGEYTFFAFFDEVLLRK